MNSNICEKHFPEPIIYMSDRPLCKKCIPEYLETFGQKAKKDKEAKEADKGKDGKDDKEDDEQAKESQQMVVANMLGLTSFSQ